MVVLGHPDYYPRFGFERASTHGLTCQWEGVPDEAFMVLILVTDAMEGVSGVMEYGDEFSEAVQAGNRTRASSRRGSATQLKR